MLDILEKYESLIRFIQGSNEFDKEFLDDILDFLYKREQMLDDDTADVSLVDLWTKDAD